MMKALLRRCKQYQIVRKKYTVDTPSNETFVDPAVIAHRIYIY